MKCETYFLNLVRLHLITTNYHDEWFIFSSDRVEAPFRPKRPNTICLGAITIRKYDDIFKNTD